MRLVSVNVGKARTILKDKTAETTGIYKLPVADPVEVTALGLQGDQVCNQKHHGGPDQAVYLYGEPDYNWWSIKLGRVLEPGTFGENLTIGEMESAQINIGDRFHIGSVILEATAPRIPCSTLAARVGDPQFVMKYRKAERPGVYCRVIREGALQAGDEVGFQPFAGAPVPALEIFRHYHSHHGEEALLRKFLNAPIAARARRDIEAELQGLVTSKSSGLGQEPQPPGDQQ